MKYLPKKNNFNYKWIRKDDTLPSSAQGVKTSQMTIVNLRVRDSGDYQCVMSNSTGALSSNFTKLIVRSERDSHIYTQYLATVFHFNYRIFTKIA